MMKQINTTCWLVWQAIKAKLRQRFFRAFYRNIVEIKETRMDGRPSQELTLECGHQYWRYSVPAQKAAEKRWSGALVHQGKIRLCDACLKIYLYKSYNKHKADTRMSLFEKFVKGR